MDGDCPARAGHGGYFYRADRDCPDRGADGEAG